MCGLCSDAKFIRMSGSVTMPWQPTASLAHVFTLLMSALRCLVTQVPPCSVPVCRCTVLMYLLAILYHTSIAPTARVASLRWWRRLPAIASNVAGMIGTEVGMSVQNAAVKVQWCVSPINFLPTGCQRFPISVFFLSS